MIKLTQLETQVLKELISELYAEPGFSDVDANDIAQSINLSSKIIRGVLGSLSQKGIIDIEATDTYGSESYQIIYLNYNHWYLHPEWKNEQEWPSEKMTVTLE